MRLAEFIEQHTASILADWDAFARTSEPAASSMDAVALRNHAAYMLRAIVEHVRTPQGAAQSLLKANARASEVEEETAAHTHGAARLLSGFTLDQLVAEYRALRASVLRRWEADGQTGMASDRADVTRFNEAIDQALAESISRYTSMVNHAHNLFLAILGHDLRNPLNTTLMAASHLGAVLPLAMAPADMGTICRTVTEEMRQIHPGQRILYTTCEGLDGVWDEGRMAQVLSNLVGNAVQHGGADAVITIETAPGRAEMLIAVHNTGKPIPPDALDSIFDPLVRFAPGSGTDQSSLGIGLYIARALVQAHGGSIECARARTAPRSPCACRA